MRLIDADALLDEYCGDCNNVARQICGDDPICGTAMMIKDAPTVDDAVVVVRCEKCVHWNNGDCYRLELSRPTDFCSYGERKSDNE